MAKAGEESSQLSEIVLTAIARDRPGVVEKLAEAIAAHDGNWIDSSMARLGGEFAGIVRAEAPSMNMAALEAALAGLSTDGIDVTIHKAETYTEPGGRRARLELTGIDHKGIVLEVTRTLAGNGVSIDELDTSVSRGSMGAEPLFTAQAEIVLPPGLELAALRDALERIARDIMVDIDIHRVETD